MDIAVSGLGMIASVGHDVVTACASLRAGITRAQEIVSFSILETETYEESLLVGHRAGDITNGFVLVGAWLQLALASLEDLQRYAALPDIEDAEFWSRTGLMVVIPAELERFGEGSDDVALLWRAYAEPLARLWDSRIDPHAVSLVPGGNAGGTAGIEQASVAIRTGKLDRVIVLGADSFFDELSLEWLAAAGRLKTPDNPVGLAPGEASACVLLESRESVSRRDGRLEGLIASAFVDHRPVGRDFDEARTGQVLGRAIRRSVVSNSGRQRFSGEVVADLNGEVWRASELGNATVRVLDVFGDVRWTHPALCVGHTGAASGLVGICVAVRALGRTQRRHDQALILASAEEGLVGVVHVSAIGG